MKLLVSLAILALAAAQTPAIHTEEVVPEFESEDFTGKVDFLVQSYSHAKEALAKNGEAGCKKLADDTENAVKVNVNAEQTIINAMDNGGDCHTSGDSLIAAAENKLEQAKTDERKAREAKEKAEGQDISLGSRSFKQLESIISKGKCNKDIIMGSDYAAAVATVNALRNAHASARGAITEAEGGVRDAKKEAAKLVNTCMCNVIKEHDAAVKAANTKNKDANLKAWTQAAHIRCVVDSVSMANCKVGEPPVVVPAQLAAGVKCQAEYEYVTGNKRCAKDKLVKTRDECLKAYKALFPDRAAPTSAANGQSTSYAEGCFLYSYFKKPGDLKFNPNTKANVCTNRWSNGCMCRK